MYAVRPVIPSTPSATSTNRNRSTHEVCHTPHGALRASTGGALRVGCKPPSTYVTRQNSGHGTLNFNGAAQLVDGSAAHGGTIVFGGDVFGRNAITHANSVGVLTLQAGDQRTQIPLKTTDAIFEPDVFWRLTRLGPGGIF